MRSPLQGGLPPAGAVNGAVVEIACDESGFSGTNLLDPVTPVITHASVDLDRTSASSMITLLRSSFQFSPQELKSGRFLRLPRAEEALDWFLTSLRGRAHVHVISKELFLVTRIADLFLAEPSYLAGTRLSPARHSSIVALHQAGRARGAAWDAFLTAFVGMVKTKRRGPAAEVMARFFQARDALGPLPLLAELTPGVVSSVLARVDAGDRLIPPPLEPLLPALAETVLTWSAGGRRVLVTHDEQSALTADRLTRLQQALATASGGASPLAGLVVADSRDDPRIQVADLLAGVARRSPTLIPDLGPPA